MGRSRGGLTTKIHALVDAEGRPIRLKLTEGQAHDGRSATDMLDTIEPGNILLADRAYDSDALRAEAPRTGRLSFLVEEGPDHGDGSRWVLFHDPVAGIRNDALGDVCRG